MAQWMILLALSYHFFTPRATEHSLLDIKMEDLTSAECRIDVGVENSNRTLFMVNDIQRPDVVYDHNLGKEYTLQSQDQLISVDNEPVAVEDLGGILQSPPGTQAVLPLIDLEAGALQGFVRIEILDPVLIQFMPSSNTRKSQVRHRRRQHQLEKEENMKKQRELRDTQTREAERKQREEEMQRERKRKQEVENARIDKIREEASRKQEEKVKQLEKKRRSEALAQQQEATEKVKITANGLNPSENIPTARKIGAEFLYEAKFSSDEGPIGINWKISDPEKSLVDSIEPRSAAAELHIIMPGDQLMEVNGIKVSHLNPMQMIPIYRKARLPRILKFRSPERQVAESTSEATKPKYILHCVYPMLLANVSFSVDAAEWSAKPSDQCDLQWISISDPLTACGPIQQSLNTELQQNVWPNSKLTSFVICYRGECTFPEKAKNIVDFQGTGLLIVNSVAGEAKFPPVQGTIENVPIPVTMISKAEGNMLVSILESEPGLCYLDNQADPCQHSPERRQQFGELWKPFMNTLTPNPQLPSSAKLLITRAKKTPPFDAFDYIQAKFGGPLSFSPHRLVVSYPFYTACEAEGVKVGGKGAVVLVGRGQCTFTQKALIIQATGAIGMIVVNTEDEPIEMTSPPNESPAIWVVMVGRASGENIEKVIQENSQHHTYVRITR